MHDPIRGWVIPWCARCVELIRISRMVQRQGTSTWNLKGQVTTQIRGPPQGMKGGVEWHASDISVGFSLCAEIVFFVASC